MLTHLPCNETASPASPASPAIALAPCAVNGLYSIRTGFAGKHTEYNNGGHVSPPQPPHRLLLSPNSRKVRLTRKRAAQTFLPPEQSVNEMEYWRGRRRRRLEQDDDEMASSLLIKIIVQHLLDDDKQ